jgi:hypothetical protein
VRFRTIDQHRLSALGETPGSMASGRRLAWRFSGATSDHAHRTVQQLERWANGSAVNPDERIRKDQLKAILGGTAE